jgi:hypothetical protein
VSIASIVSVKNACWFMRPPFVGEKLLVPGNTTVYSILDSMFVSADSTFWNHQLVVVSQSHPCGEFECSGINSCFFLIIGELSKPS